MKRSSWRFLTIALMLSLSLVVVPAMTPGVATAQDEVVAADFPAGTDVYVFDGPVNLRSGAGTTFSIVAVVPQGAIVEVTGNPTPAGGHTWYPVNYSTFTGFMAGTYLKEVGFAIGDEVEVDTDYLNLRSGPGTGSGVITVLRQGTTATITNGPTAANGYNWYQINTGANQGWVAGFYLALTYIAPPPVDGGFVIGSYIFVNDPPVNVRSGAGTGNSVIGTLPLNQWAIVIGGPVSANGYPWWQIETATLTGWVAGDFFGGGAAINGYARVFDGPLNLRAAPGTGSAIVEVLAQGAVVETLNVAPTFLNGAYWFQVEAQSGATGYVSGFHIEHVTVG
jgi:uncharacterized protein YraI